MKFNAVTLTLLALLALSTACEGKQTPNATNLAKSSPLKTSAETNAPQKVAPSPESPALEELKPGFERIKAKEKILAQIVLALLEHQHLQQKPVNDELSSQAFDSFLKRLDPGKLFLLEDQVKGLEVYRKSIDDQLKSGNFELAIKGEMLYQEQVQMVKKIVDGHLSKPFDLTKTESLETDIDKRSFCKTEAELNDRWRKALKLQVLQRMARLEEQSKTRAELKAEGKLDELPKTELPTDDKGREAHAREKLEKDYSARFARLERQEHIDAIDQFINAITSVYDPHSAYLPPAKKENFDIQMSGSLEGIGAVLSIKDHYVEVVRIVPGSASWRQGELEASDIILMVAQNNEDPVDVVDMPLNDVVRLIRGKKGTTVKLTVKKPDGRLKTVPIVRDVVQLEAAYARGAVLRGGNKKPVGYINLPSFYGNTRGGPSRSSSSDVRLLLEAFNKKGVSQVILDLRSNGGGYLNDAKRMSGLFFERGPVVQTRAANGTQRSLTDDDASTVFKGKVIVLVDSFSASASEIVAGALQDYGRAVVVGTSQTHGKGTVQMILNLDRFVESPEHRSLMPLGVLKLTEQQFFRVSGASTQNRGIIPDIQLPDPAGYIESGERHLDFAIPWSAVKATPFKAWTEKSWDVKTLNASSQARQKKSAAFQQVNERVSLLKKRRDNTVVNLNYKAWSENLKKETEELKALTPDNKKSPALFVVQEVNYTGEAPPKPQATPGKDGRNLGEDPASRWQEDLARDPWVEECIFILNEM